MPENHKSSQQKNKNEPKEQRRKRQQNRHPPGPVDKKVETGVTKPAVPVAEKSLPSEPPPEFYENLKRETDEILKITEEANSKYKKKEIQSNWAKYEMPIESYEEIDEQESIGADFESLIQASLSVGGHFQFKHEKSWDVTTGPSAYDKYFDIDMDKLNLGLSTIPFHERNNIDASLFTESDILSMNHRAIKYKNKFNNDNKYTTPELEAEKKLLSMMKLGDNECNETKSKIDETVIDSISDVNLDYSKEVENNDLTKIEMIEENVTNMLESPKALKTKEDEEQTAMLLKSSSQDKNKLIEDVKTVPPQKEQESHVKENIPENADKNPVIESPEDLEKWLDDFLDG